MTEKKLKHFISTVTIRNGEYETFTNYCFSSDSRESAVKEVNEAFDIGGDNWEQQVELYSLVGVSEDDFNVLKKYI